MQRNNGLVTNPFVEDRMESHRCTYQTVTAILGSGSCKQNWTSVIVRVRNQCWLRLVIDWLMVKSNTYPQLILKAAEFS